MKYYLIYDDIDGSTVEDMTFAPNKVSAASKFYSVWKDKGITYEEVLDAIKSENEYEYI